MYAKTILDPHAWLWLALLLWAFRSYRQSLHQQARTLLLIALSLTAWECLDFSHYLLSTKERAYRETSTPNPRTLANHPIDAVVMCGGVMSVSAPDYTGANYSSAIDRFLKAVEWARATHKPLVLGGGTYAASHQRESDYLQAWLSSWGAPGITCYQLPACRNTHDEAIATAALATQHGWKCAALVTSAYHLDRAAATFRKTRLQIVPVGCDYLGRAEAHPHLRCRLFPSTATIDALHCYLCEQVGYLYYRCRNWI